MRWSDLRAWRPPTSRARRRPACGYTARPDSPARCAVTPSARSPSPTPRCSTAPPARPEASRSPTVGCLGCSSKNQELSRTYRGASTATHVLSSPASGQWWWLTLPGGISNLCDRQAGLDNWRYGCGTGQAVAGAGGGVAVGDGSAALLGTRRAAVLAAGGGAGAGRGLLGGVALGALAGARRTATAYGR